MHIYTAQIFIRKCLNSIHTELYQSTGDAEKKPQKDWSTKVQDSLAQDLEEWRSTLEEIGLAWDNGEAPSGDINVARMRGKYYGARYIIFRPSLHYALQLLEDPKSSNHSPSIAAGRSSQQASPSSAFNSVNVEGSRRSSEMGPPPRLIPREVQRLPPPILAACRKCVEAAVQSTIAFDGITSGRWIVTNIFGTAHA